METGWRSDAEEVVFVPGAVIVRFLFAATRVGVEGTETGDSIDSVCDSITALSRGLWWCFLVFRIAAFGCDLKGGRIESEI